MVDYPWAIEMKLKDDKRFLNYQTIPDTILSTLDISEMQDSEYIMIWTVNKKINVFEKKLIFIPINANLHWSLCVVVNPGLIANSFTECLPHQERSW